MTDFSVKRDSKEKKALQVLRQPLAEMSDEDIENMIENGVLTLDDAKEMMKEFAKTLRASIVVQRKLVSRQGTKE